MYTVDYFIKKFSRIPAGLWCVGDIGEGNKRCALGHCGVTRDKATDEGDALQSILGDETAEINDAQYDYHELGDNPRTRILRALKRVKNGKQV